MKAEQARLEENNREDAPWHRWGPYLSARQWGTVREDYSPDGTSWDYFPHDDARSRAYRWGEDGLLGISDRHGMLCFAIALWNGKDPILKERLFGLTNSQGNHGEDVKECFFFTDCTPTHSYMKALYKYPQAAFPYKELWEENRRRGRSEPEYELVDTGIFDGGKYFDVVVEYAKASVDDLSIRLTVKNRGSEPAKLCLLPQVWFRNRWSWAGGARPLIKESLEGFEIDHPKYGGYRLEVEGTPLKLFTENDTNVERVFGAPNSQPFVKDAFHEFIVDGNRECVNPKMEGTKAAAVYHLELGAGKSGTVHLSLMRGRGREHKGDRSGGKEEWEAEKSSQIADGRSDGWQDADRLFAKRIKEADEFS